MRVSIIKKLQSFLYILCISACSITLNAQIIKGKVTDSNTGEPLTGATVKLEGTKYATLVKLDGTYSFTKIAAGTYTVTISYAGYKKSTGETAVTVGADEIKIVSVALEPKATEMESVTITSNGAGGDRGARRLEKLADPVLNVLSAKTIQLLPDITVANALQRVSGVTIEKSSSGEGRYPIIRGMEKRYINTLVNGIKIPSPDNKNRFIPLDLFPSELLERLEVSKSLTPSMEGDAIGGTINLVMKDAPADKLLQANFSTGYNNIFGRQVYNKFDNSTMNKQSPSQINGNTYAAQPSNFSVAHLNYNNNKAYPVNSTWGLSIGNRFGKDKKLGVLFSGSYQNQYKGVTSTIFKPNAQPNLNNIPQFVNLVYREYSEHIQRLGLTAKIDYKLNNRNKLSLTSTCVKLNNFQARVDNDTTALNFLVSDANRSTWQYQSIFNSTLQGNHQLSTSAKIDWSLVYSMANNNIPDQSTFSHQYQVVIDPATGRYKKTGEDIVGGMTRTWIKNNDKDYAAYLNFTKQAKLFTKVLEIKLGGLVREKNRDNFYNSYSLNPLLPATGSQIQKFTTINNVAFTFKGANALPGLNGNNYTFKEDIITGYLQAKWSLSPKLEILGGARIENTRQQYNTELGPEVDYRSGTITYSDILPSAQLKYKLNNNQTIRAAYYKALARPQFAEMIPFGNDNFEVFKEKGNPVGLEHTTADNFDLRYEFFPGKADQILVGVFYKTIQNPIEITASKVGVTETNLIPKNISDATNYGFEAVFTKYFGSFGVSANYTYTQSKVTNDSMLVSYRNAAGVPTSKYVSETRPLQGQANHIGNISLIYKNPKNGFDAQLAFVYTGERIYLLSPYAGLHYWQQPSNQLDFSFEKRIIKKFTFYGKINNILNTPSVGSLHLPYNTYLNSGGAPISLQTDPGKTIIVQKDYYKTSFLFGFRYKF
jgi:outer membrane receptor protein involved in Fe transport